MLLCENYLFIEELENVEWINQIYTIVRIVTRLCTTSYYNCHCVLLVEQLGHFSVLL